MKHLFEIRIQYMNIPILGKFLYIYIHWFFHLL